MMRNWGYCKPNRRRKPRQEEMDFVRRRIEELGIQVVSDEEAEEVDVVVCNTADIWSPFRDNVLTTCAECGAGIYHRPYMPKKPRKVCINCAVALHDKEEGKR